MILLAKVGFSAEQVWQMPIVEAAAWLDDLLESRGVKRPTEVQSGTTIVSLRRPRPASATTPSS